MKQMPKDILDFLAGLEPNEIAILGGFPQKEFAEDFLRTLKKEVATAKKKKVLVFSYTFKLRREGKQWYIQIWTFNSLKGAKYSIEEGQLVLKNTFDVPTGGL